ncbi:hypothetical protein ACFQX6_63905 [Streptosporangium lutulentum]
MPKGSCRGHGPEWRRCFLGTRIGLTSLEVGDEEVALCRACSRLACSPPDAAAPREGRDRTNHCGRGQSDTDPNRDIRDAHDVHGQSRGRSGGNEDRKDPGRGGGRTLYLFEKDKDGKSACSGPCAQAWPPFVTSEKPKAENGVKENLLGTVKRDDGETQVTYNGHPLYYYIKDQKAATPRATTSTASAPSGTPCTRTARRCTARAARLPGRPGTTVAATPCRGVAATVVPGAGRGGRRGCDRAREAISGTGPGGARRLAAQFVPQPHT